MRSIMPKEERDESSYGAWPLILVAKVNGTRPFFFRSVTIPYELSLHNSQHVIHSSSCVVCFDLAISL